MIRFPLVVPGFMDVYDNLLKEFLACVEGHEMPKEAVDHIKRVTLPCSWV
jgi:hypothetical protein